MKKFETPIAEIEKFEVADIITVSTVVCETDGCDTLTEPDWG